MYMRPAPILKRPKERTKILVKRGKYETTFFHRYNQLVYSCEIRSEQRQLYILERLSDCANLGRAQHERSGLNFQHNRLLGLESVRAV